MLYRLYKGVRALLHPLRVEWHAMRDGRSVYLAAGWAALVRTVDLRRHFAPGRRGGRGAGGRVWIDVGAHLGQTGFDAAFRDPRLTVYAFEPNLDLALQRLGRLGNYHVIPMAVAEQTGAAQFHLSANGYSSSLLPFDPAGVAAWVGDPGELRTVASALVPTIRLDEFLVKSGIDAVDFLKIDTQGTDLAVVRSLGEEIRRVRRIQLEVQTSDAAVYVGQSRPDDVLAYMSAHGFRRIGVQSQSHGQEQNWTFEPAATT